MRLFKRDKKKAAKKEPILRNGNPPESVSESELVILHGIQAEIEALKRQETLHQRSLTLASADLIRKTEELAVKIKEVAKKYDLGKLREFSFKTGEIRTIKKAEK